MRKPIVTKVNELDVHRSFDISSTLKKRAMNLPSDCYYNTLFVSTILTNRVKSWLVLSLFNQAKI